MYDYELRKTQGGFWEVDVLVPIEPKVIAGMQFDRAPITQTFTAAAVFKGQFGDVPFKTDGERNLFAKTLGSELISRGVRPEAVCV